MQYEIAQYQCINVSTYVSLRSFSYYLIHRWPLWTNETNSYQIVDFEENIFLSILKYSEILFIVS